MSCDTTVQLDIYSLYVMVMPYLVCIIIHRLVETSLPLEIRGEVHYISLVGDRNLLVLDRNKLPLPPLYSRYFMWGFPDRSARVAFVEADKVCVCRELGWREILSEVWSN